MLEFILGKHIAGYVRRHRSLVILSLLLTAVASLFVVIPAYLLQPFVDEGMKTGSDPVAWKIPWISLKPGTWFSWERTERVLVEGISPNHLLILLTFVAFLSVVFKSVSIYLGGLCGAAFSNRAVKSLRIDLFRKFVSLPLGFYHDKKSGELIARATADLTVMQGLIASVLTGLIENPLTATVFLCYLLIMNFRLTVLVFVVVPVIVGLVRLFGRKVKKHSIRVQDATAQVTSAYQETLLCLRLVHGFFTGNREVSRFSVLADQLYQRVMHWSRWQLGLSPMMDATVFMVLPGILIFGKIYFHHTLGELISMVYAFSRVYAPIKRLAMVNNNLKTLQGATMYEGDGTVRLGIAGLEFEGKHGVLEEERLLGNRFRVDIEIDADVDGSLSSDDLADSIDYREMAKIIDTVSSRRHYRLIESLAAAIVDELLRRLPQACTIRLHLAKLCPPGLPPGAETFVRITRSRE